MELLCFLFQIVDILNNTYNQVCKISSEVLEHVKVSSGLKDLLAGCLPLGWCYNELYEFSCS